MEHLKKIQDTEQIKILTDSRRLAILKMLMNEPATLTQLGQVLEEHPARVRHHLKLLEKAGLVEMTHQRIVRGFVEKYYRAKARAFLMQDIVLPQYSADGMFTFLGSHDLALEVLATQLLRAKLRSLKLFIIPIGSLDGLVALREGIAQIAGCHLLDIETGEYNLPFVRHLFPDKQMRIITLAHREQGLLVAAGNPLGIRSVTDLVRQDVRIINRNRGSGTRLWLDRQIQKLDISPETLVGYDNEVRTHTAVAEAVLASKADVGLGLLAAAQKSELEFIPLFRERFDLVFPQELADTTNFTTLFDFLSSGHFRRLVRNLGGYETEHTGDELTMS
jgi:molybdate-binding protein/predicted transcriptional regulator